LKDPSLHPRNAGSCNTKIASHDAEFQNRNSELPGVAPLAPRLRENLKRKRAGTALEKRAVFKTPKRNATRELSFKSRLN
jgi:hypothetical protein